MENKEVLDTFISLTKQYGPNMATWVFIAWIYILNPMWKKTRGKYVSYKTLNGEIADLKDDKKILNSRVAKLEQERILQLDVKDAKDIKLDSLEIAQQRFDRDMEEVKYMVRDFIATQKTTNRLLGETKDCMKELLEYLKGNNKQG